MNPSIFIWLIYAFWVLLIAYLTVSAIGVKQEPQGHLLQSLGLLLAIIAAFLLPYLPIFHFLNFAPVNAVANSIGKYRRNSLCGGHVLLSLGASASRWKLEPDRKGWA